jgi:ATP-dependent 26S proteasome regulatory subunit
MMMNELMNYLFLFSSTQKGMLINTILTGIIMLISTYWRDIERFYKKTTLWMNRSNVIELHGSVTEDRSEIMAKFSNKMKAIIHYISQHCMHNENLKKLIELSYNNYYCFESKGLETEFFINQTSPFEIAPQIQCMIEITDNNFHVDRKIVKNKDITLYIYSTSLSIQQLKTFLQQIEEEYDEYINVNMNKHTYCFVFAKTDDHNKPYFIHNKFQSNKTFDNLVFRDKTMLKERLDFFLNNKSFYEKLGIPYTLGLLFHGLPGTGKTSTIKAIANYTKRHLIIIPMNKVKTNSTLRDVILTDEIGIYNIPHHKRLYVFEEIDCNGMAEIIAPRDNNEKIKDSISEDDIVFLKDIIDTEKSKRQSSKTYPCNEQENENDKVTLGGLLELLDGINEATGRMLVMTTNSDPTKFDKALIRPGRIDCNIEFKRCDHAELNQLYELWFNKSIPKEKLLQIKEEAYTPAELGEIFIRSTSDPDTIIEELIIR